MIPQILLRTATIFGGIAVSKAISKVLPITVDQFKSDPIATIGSTIIQAAAADAVMNYVEDRICSFFDGIAATDPAELADPTPAPKPATKNKK